MMIKYFYIIFAPSFLLYLIIKRILMVNVNYSLEMLPLWKTFVYSCIFLSTIILLLNIIMIIFNNNKESYIKTILNKHTQEYINALKTVDIVFKNKIKNFCDIIEFYNKNLIPFLIYRKYVLYNTFVIYYILPKIIILIAFFYDILIIKTFYYFYIALLLIFLSMLFDYFIVTLQQEYSMAIKEIEPFIEIRNKKAAVIVYKENEEIIVTLSKPILLQKVINDVIILDKKLSSYDIMLSYYFFKKVKDPSKINKEATLLNFQKLIKDYIFMYTVLYHFENQKSKLQLYFSLIYCIFYLIGWFIILSYNVENLLNLLFILENIIKIEPFSGICITDFTESDT